MSLLHSIIVTIQVISAAILIFIIATQTTKSEQGGSGMGWGTIGGQVSSTVQKFGKEAQITRLTTWVAVSFFALSFLGALLEAHLR